MSDNSETTGKSNGQKEGPSCCHEVLFCCFVLFSTTGTSNLSLKDHSILVCPRAFTGQAIPNHHLAFPTLRARRTRREGHSRVLMGRSHGPGRQAHAPQHLSVGVRILQGLSLELDGGQSAVDL